MRERSLLVGLILLLSVWGFPLGQSNEEKYPIVVRMTASPSKITVGDQFQLIVEASYRKDTVVEMPGPDIDLGELELIDHRHMPLSEGESGLIVAQSIYTLTAFSTGEFEIPAVTLRFRVTSVEAEEQTVQTEPVIVNVESVLTSDSEGIRDIKPPLEIPRDWFVLLLAFALGAALVTLAFLLWRRRRGTAHQDAASAAPKLPAHIEALRELNRLGNSGLLDRGEIVRFHVEVSEIIRRYFARRYGIDALETTSEELLAELPGDISLALPRALLRQCDLVKFAKFEPVRSQSERMLEIAHEIVETTKPRFDSSSPSAQREELDLENAVETLEVD